MTPCIACAIEQELESHLGYKPVRGGVTIIHGDGTSRVHTCKEKK